MNNYIITDTQMKTFCDLLVGKYSERTGNKTRTLFRIDSDDSDVLMEVEVGGIPFIESSLYVIDLFVAYGDGENTLGKFHVKSKEISKEAYKMLITTCKDIRKGNQDEVKRDVVKRLLGD